MNTAAIASAFDQCVELGGGYVEVPPGRFLTGEVALRSGCYLVLHHGGILQATTNISQYGGGGNAAFSAQTHYLVSGRRIGNSGVIAPPGASAGGELRGTMWQSIRSYDAATNSFTKLFPGAAVGNLLVEDSTNITVAGVRIMHSGFWAQTFRRCSNVLEERVVVEGSVQWGTADGLDVESGYNLTFRDSVFKTGDDCLAFRSGGYEATPAWPAGPVQPVQRVRISNVSLVSSSSAIKFEASTIGNRTDVGDIFDVVVDGVRIRDTNRGIGIWQRSGQRDVPGGRGRIYDVTIRNVDSVTRFDSKPQFWGSGEPFALTVLPRNGDCCAGVRNITLTNVSAVAENSALLTSLAAPSPPGVPAAPAAITGVRFENVSITIKVTGNSSRAPRAQRDYRPSGSGLPQTAPSPVVGIAVENVADLWLGGGGGVRFASPAGGRPAYWGGACVNVSGQSRVRAEPEPGWTCDNRLE
eukprot:g3431.t1